MVSFGNTELYMEMRMEMILIFHSAFLQEDSKAPCGYTGGYRSAVGSSGVGNGHGADPRGHSRRSAGTRTRARHPPKPGPSPAAAGNEMKPRCRKGFIKMAHLLLQNGHVHDGIE